MPEDGPSPTPANDPVKGTGAMEIKKKASRRDPPEPGTQNPPVKNPTSLSQSKKKRS